MPASHHKRSCCDFKNSTQYLKKRSLANATTKRNDPQAYVASRNSDSNLLLSNRQPLSNKSFKLLQHACSMFLFIPIHQQHQLRYHRHKEDYNPANKEMLIVSKINMVAVYSIYIHSLL